MAEEVILMAIATHSRLATSVVSAVLPAADSERAKAFYRDKLGLDVEDLAGAPGYFFVHGGKGSQFLVYEHGTSKADHTQISFEVEDIEAAVAELRERGVTFQEYNMPDFKTVNGIAEMGNTKSAWIVDTEGNIIALNQM